MSPHRALFLALILVGGASACTSDPEDSAVTDTPEVQPSEVPEPVSILRPDVQAETENPDAQPAQDLRVTIGFPEGGSELDTEALAALEELVATSQFASSAAIVIRAHGDSAGSDTANERASEARGLAVAEWLIAAGADPRRIDVIVYGEQNPIEPNALPDGSPNEAGRAINRRVEVEILAQPSEATEEEASEVSDEG
jgi:outer membrane protein OmpA-like peptidoglycan-associated protein